MVGIHAARISGHFGKSRHPHVAHLFRHAQIRRDDIFLFLPVDQCTERMCSTISIPDPVVIIERSTVIFVHFSVESTKIATIFAHTNRTFESTVERRVKYSFIIFCTSLYFYTTQSFIPYPAASFCKCLYIVVF